MKPVISKDAWLKHVLMVLTEKSEQLHQRPIPGSSFMVKIQKMYGQQEEKEVIEFSKPEILRVIEEFENGCFSPSLKTT